MNPLPQVSVVMSVYNGAGHLSETLESVLNQQDCDFEFIVVNDGSTDATAIILDNYAKVDKRLRVINQDNTGLTRALILGCLEARGEFIARQDAGDISLPGRLNQQRVFLLNYPDAVMAACAVRYSGPLHERLYEVVKKMHELDDGLRQPDLNRLSGPPHHGGTMFHRAAYLKAGGYRSIFTVAQDMDLWLRLSELGSCLGMPEILYEARLEAGSISSRRRNEQFRLGALALECAKHRKAGLNDQLLIEAYVPLVKRNVAINRFEKARFHYYIASCMLQHDRNGARRYFLKALAENPFHWKALFRLMTS